MKKFQLVFLIILSAVVIYTGYLQINNIYKVNKINEIKKEIVSLNKKIKDLKLEKETINNDVSTTSKELTDLNASLLQVETDLATATKKLNSLN